MSLLASSPQTSKRFQPSSSSNLMSTAPSIPISSMSSSSSSSRMATTTDLGPKIHSAMTTTGGRMKCMEISSSLDHQEKQQNVFVHKNNDGANYYHSNDNENENNNGALHHGQYLYVLPVLGMEFLALALTRAVLPPVLIAHFGHRQVFGIMGLVDCIRGLLAFWSCPLFGQISDLVGRKPCLIVTVIGTCMSVCVLGLGPWTVTNNNNDGGTAMAMPTREAILIFIGLLSLSGLFSSTFPLVFTYISDTTPSKERVAAYGLALATFGLSFTIGPMLGGYLATYNPRHVFAVSLLLTILDVIYIIFFVPESKQFDPETTIRRTESAGTMSTTSAWRENLTLSHLSSLSWNPWKTIQFIFGPTSNRLLQTVGYIALYYYTALWAVLSTLVLYAAERFQLSSDRLGEIMSCLGLCTMLSEAVLIRLLVPLWGEATCVLAGLVAFGIQCIGLALAIKPWHLYVCILPSLLGNLVYPSMTSLLSQAVESQHLGEVLGAMNGIKALTEGVGPLLFGGLLMLSNRQQEHQDVTTDSMPIFDSISSLLPGWPYLLVSILVYIAYQYALQLRDLVVTSKEARQLERRRITEMMEQFAARQTYEEQRQAERDLSWDDLDDDEDDDEYRGLLSTAPLRTPTRQKSLVLELSEVEESDDDAVADVSRLPITFASLMTKNKRKKKNNGHSKPPKPPR